MAISLENVVKTAMVDAVTSQLGTQAVINFYTASTGLPTATTGVASIMSTALSCANPAMGAAVNGVGTFGAITSNVVGTAGTVAWYAILAATNATRAAWLGSVATQTADMTFNTTVWAGGDNISISSLTFTQP